MKKRADRIEEQLDRNNVEAILFSKPENIRYLSGFTGGNDAVLLLGRDKRYIITDSRYTEQVKKESPGWQLLLEKPPARKELTDLLLQYKRVGFESDTVSYREYVELKKKCSCELVALSSVVEAMRIIKDDEELNLLRQAAKIGDRVFTDICKLVKTGVSEKHVANNIAYLIREYGCQKESFDTIAVSGDNAALPHGQPGDKLLQKGDMLTLDFGGFYQGYASDMTRTVAVGEADRALRDRYMAVLEAQVTGVEMIRAGLSCREIDAAVRKCLQKYDLDQYFQHGTGHGVGLEIHETPVLSARSDTILEENMVVTVEPGIYIPGWGGIRIEDTVIVKEAGCEIITRSDKDLLIIDGGIE